jgi:hypothetical protein
MIIDGEILGRAARLRASLCAAMEEHPSVTLAASREAMPEGIARRARAARPARPARVERGQLWVAAPEPGASGARSLVLVTRVEGGRCEALGVHDEPWIAGDRDVILPGDVTPIGQCLAVLLEVPLSVARGGLVHFVGSLPPEVLATVRAVAALPPGARTEAASRSAPREEIPGGGRCARTVLRRALDAERAALAWLSGEACDDPDDPRAEVRALLSEATAWLIAPRASAPVEPPANLRARLDGLLAQASAPPMTAGLGEGPADPEEPAIRGLVVGALVGALRGAEEGASADVRFELALFAGCVARVRVGAEAGAFVASAHIPGLQEGQRASLTLRNLATSEAIEARDHRGVLPSIRLPSGLVDPVELSVGVGDAVVRLAF